MQQEPRLCDPQPLWPADCEGIVRQWAPFPPFPGPPLWKIFTRGLVKSLNQRLWEGEAVPLGVVDADLPQDVEGRPVLDRFGDGADAHDLADLVDRLDEGALDRVAQHVAHEAAVDLEEVDLEVLEVGEGGEAAAEIVEHEAEAELFQDADEVDGLGQVADGGGL